MTEKDRAKLKKLMGRLEKAVMGVHQSRSTGELMDEAKLELRNARMGVMAYAEWLVALTSSETRQRHEKAAR